MERSFDSRSVIRSKIAERFTDEVNIEVGYHHIGETVNVVLVANFSRAAIVKHNFDKTGGAEVFDSLADNAARLKFATKTT